MKKILIILFGCLLLTGCFVSDNEVEAKSKFMKNIGTQCNGTLTVSYSISTWGETLTTTCTEVK